MRILQGIGGALMVPVGRLMALRETPKGELITAIAVLTWPALVAPVLRPPLSGLIADHGDWRLIFWLNLPLGALAFLLALLIVSPGAAMPFRVAFLVAAATSFLAVLDSALLRPDAGDHVAGGKAEREGAAPLPRSAICAASSISASRCLITLRLLPSLRRRSAPRSSSP